MELNDYLMSTKKLYLISQGTFMDRNICSVGYEQKTKAV